MQGSLVRTFSLLAMVLFYSSTTLAQNIDLDRDRRRGDEEVPMCSHDDIIIEGLQEGELIPEYMYEYYEALYWAELVCGYDSLVVEEPPFEIAGPNGYVFQFKTRDVCGVCKVVWSRVYRLVPTCPGSPNPTQELTYLISMQNWREEVKSDLNGEYCFMVNYNDSVKVLTGVDFQCKGCGDCSDEMNAAYGFIGNKLDFCSLGFGDMFKLKAYGDTPPSYLSGIIENSACTPSDTQSGMLDCFWLGTMTGYNNKKNLTVTTDRIVNNNEAPLECTDKNVVTETTVNQDYQTICEIIDGGTRNTTLPFSKLPIKPLFVGPPHNG